MLKYWLWLATRKGLGPRGALAVLRRFGSPELAYCAGQQDYEGMDALRDSRPLLDKDMQVPERILQQCYQKNIHILTYQDAAYPERLKNIDDPPVVLYYQGTVPAVDTEPVIAMVGTRKASAYGLLQAGKCRAVVGNRRLRFGHDIFGDGHGGHDRLRHQFEHVRLRRRGGNRHAVPHRRAHCRPAGDCGAWLRRGCGVSCRESISF